jgi:hypothetical protein
MAAHAPGGFRRGAYRSAVRWAWTEAPHGPEELCNFPGVPEMHQAARRLDA